MLRIPNKDPAPSVLCEFCKITHPHGNAPQVHLITNLSKFRDPPEWCETVSCAAGCCIKSVKNVFRARTRRAGAMRGSLQLISRVIVLSIPGYGSYTYPKEVGTILRKASNFFAHE